MVMKPCGQALKRLAVSTQKCARVLRSKALLKGSQFFSNLNHDPARAVQ